jgi:2-polyprenyl-6-methoxyphenol hydroxylase-like FAD-dependent oxidoreductase
MPRRPPVIDRATDFGDARPIDCARLHLEEREMVELNGYGLSVAEQKPRGSRKLGERAVVIGAGIGGLAAAGALAPYFEQVDILERDRLAATAGSRPGTPQDRHPHGLLTGGLRALDQIFPGFESGLAAGGAVPVRFARDVQFERPDVGALPKRDFGIMMLCATRPLIELVLRRQVEATANITLRPAVRVTGIVPTPDGAGVRGIRFANGSGCSQILDADLVVDASGRGAPTLTLLDALGWDRPQMTEVGVDISYATVVVEIDPRATADWKLVLTLPDPPHGMFHAVMAPTEDGRWIIVIADHSETGVRIETWSDFLDASRLLTTSTLSNALRYARPPDGIRHYRFPVSTWKHFERLPRLPRGVLPVADSFCRFNPIHGQGMSSAAKQARLLQEVLRQAAAAPDPIAAVQAGFMAGVASVLETPWMMSTSADLTFPQTRGERPENFAEARQFETALFRAAVADPVVHRAVMEVAHLLKPHQRLHEPDITQRIEAASAKAAA